MPSKILIVGGTAEWTGNLRNLWKFIIFRTEKKIMSNLLGIFSVYHLLISSSILYNQLSEIHSVNSSLKVSIAETYKTFKKSSENTQKIEKQWRMIEVSERITNANRITKLLSLNGKIHIKAIIKYSIDRSIDRKSIHFSFLYQ